MTATVGTKTSQRLPVKLVGDVLPGKTPNRHLVFLHGLFGRAQSFQFLARARSIQEQYTCHFVDLCNHGRSARAPTMGYEVLARDLRAYLNEAGILSQTHEKVTLVGHSLGAKTAMAYACLFPDHVDRLVCLDASPVDRREYPHLNEPTSRMIDDAVKLGSLAGLTKESAIERIEHAIQDKVLKSALLFNLREDGSFMCNL